MHMSARGRVSVIIVLGVVIMSSSWISAQDLGGNPDRGEAIYKEQCLRCHGRLGDGNGPDAGDLIAVSNGVLFSPMHSWRGRLSDEQMVDVIHYIRALAPLKIVS
jgi:cytochrome c oxidase cbb3-type subunit 3